MKLIVMEIQTGFDGVVGTIVTTYDDTERLQAEQKYHTILSAAAVSNLQCHAATILTSDGHEVKSERYYHALPPEEPSGDTGDTGDTGETTE